MELFWKDILRCFKMEEGIIKITVNKEKAKSMLKMVETTIEMIRTIDIDKFPSNLLKEYYDILRELMTIVLLLDGYKTIGEGAHKKLIEYLGENYKQFTGHEISLLDDLRIKRNKIAYDGFFIEKSYIKRRKEDIETLIIKLKKTIEEKL